jgi:hypothetical protein
MRALPILMLRSTCSMSHARKRYFYHAGSRRLHRRDSRWAALHNDAHGPCPAASAPHAAVSKTGKTQAAAAMVGTSLRHRPVLDVCHWCDSFQRLICPQAANQRPSSLESNRVRYRSIEALSDVFPLASCCLSCFSETMKYVVAAAGAVLAALVTF